MSAGSTRYGIVVGVDGSAASNAAAFWAAREAAMRQVPLTLVHMLTVVGSAYPEMSLAVDAAAAQADEGRRVLEEAFKIAQDAVPADRKFPMACQLSFSRPAPTLAEMSEKAEMVVVGSAGRGAVGRVLLGSVSSGVVRSAKCPVAVIRAEASYLPHSNQAPVLVGTDCSPASESAIAIAFDEASRRGVTLTVLHAWSDIAVYQVPWLDWQSDAERGVAEYLAVWQERYPDVEVRRVVTLDHPGRALINESEAAQLVVVGSHGRGGAAAMLLGSVSNAVVHSVHTPVIVARPCSDRVAE